MLNKPKAILDHRQNQTIQTTRMILLAVLEIQLVRNSMCNSLLNSLYFQIFSIYALIKQSISLNNYNRRTVDSDTKQLISLITRVIQGERNLSLEESFFKQFLLHFQRSFH